MKKIVIATDSFKGSASSYEAAQAIERGVNSITDKYSILKIPMADGGEGSLEAILSTNDGTFLEVQDPSGLTLTYGELNNSAIVEVASLIGHSTGNDVYHQTSDAVGIVINDALDRALNPIVITLGGSATHDVGVGMLQQLGVIFYDEKHQPYNFDLKTLHHIKSIDHTAMDQRIKETEFIILADVNNPLSGPHGAVFTYGPQKGIKTQDLETFDKATYQLGMLMERTLNKSFIETQGTGAAGGLGAAIHGFLNGSLKNGVEEIIKYTHLEKQVKDADLVITGEGHLDTQTLHGKAPLGVAAIAKKYQIPAIAIVGGRDTNIDDIYNHGIDLVIDCVFEPISLRSARLDVQTTIFEAAKIAIRAFEL